MSTGLDSEALELAALYALSALGAAEMEAVERERRGEAAFWAEVRSLRDAAAGLAATGPSAGPRRDLWPEIRARIAPEPAGTRRPGSELQVWKQWRADAGAAAGPRVVRAGDAFEPTNIAGVRVRCLAVDEESRRVTMLVRMDPGTSYPAHRHAGLEECFVLEGDLCIEGEAGAAVLEMHPGDYQRMEEGSRHARQSTRAGCLLFITSSQHDELCA